MNASVQRMVRDASPDTRYQIERLLRQDADDRAWAEQLGPAYRQGDVARLLGKSRQAVSADSSPLRLEMRDGEIGYPVFQFDGRRKLPGIPEVIDILAPVVASPWTIASWLKSTAADLEGRAPVKALRDGNIEAVTASARRAGPAWNAGLRSAGPAQFGATAGGPSTPALPTTHAASFAPSHCSTSTAPIPQAMAGPGTTERNP